MKIYVFTAVLLFMSVHIAHAQEIQIKTFCTSMTNVDADYAPGVDVNGRLVVPADVNANVGEAIAPLAYPIDIPIQIDVIRWLGLDVSERLLETGEVNPILTNLRIHADGRVEYNGQDISDRAQHLCTDEEPKTEGVKIQKSEDMDVETLNDNLPENQSADRTLDNGQLKKPDGLKSTDAVVSVPEKGELLEGASN